MTTSFLKSIPWNEELKLYFSSSVPAEAEIFSHHRRFQNQNDTSGVTPLAFSY
jgi:hypothetical protein